MSIYIIYTYTCINILCIYLYTYKCIYVHTYTYIYTHIYKYMCVQSKRKLEFQYIRQSTLVILVLLPSTPTTPLNGL